MGALIVFVLSVGVYPANTQEWGVVTNTEWQMTPPPGYSQTPAVVIFDIGQATAELKGLELERHVRTKVFDPDNAGRAAVIEIEYFEYDHLFDFEAQILRQDGSSVKFDKKDIEIGKRGVLRDATFTFPQIKQGDILECRYKIDYYGGYDKLGPEKYFLFSQDKRYSQYKNKERYGGYDWDRELYKHVTNLPSWYFDHPVFCLKSIFIAKLGSELDYVFFTTNIPSAQMEPVSERIKFITATIYKKHTWTLENIRPFIPDSADTYDDEVKRSGLHFQLFSTVGQNRVFRGIYSDEHLEYLGRSFQGYLSEYVEKTKNMKKLARELTGGNQERRGKAEAIYNYITNNYSADSSGYVLRPTENNLKKVFANKEAAPFEINILLVEMLKIAGFEAWPVLISTRNKIPFRFTGKFNHMLALVDIDGERVLLDASSQGCPFGLLPSIVMVEDGVIVDYNNSRPIKIVGQECTITR